MIDIRALRQRMGIRQGELAKRLRIDQSTLSRYESGERPVDGPITIILEQLEQEYPEAVPPTTGANSAPVEVAQ